MAWCQVLGLASEFLTNGGDLGCVSFRLEGGDQAAQPRAQFDSAERFVVGKAREIAGYRVRNGALQ